MSRLMEIVDWQQIWQLAVNRMVEFLPKMGSAVLVLLAYWIAFRILRKTLKPVLRRAGLQEALIGLLVDSILRITMILLAILTVASQLGINVAAALAGLGILGVAVGLAAQDTVANLIAGFLIFLDKPFNVGEYLTVGEHYGEVREITMRTTRIRTLDNTYIVIPNRQIVDGVLTNHSMYGATRVNVPIGIAYKEHIPTAREVLLKAAASVQGIIEEPEPEVVVVQTGASSVDLSVRVWISDLSLERPIYAAVLEACKLALDDAGIQIPYHHLQLFVDRVEDQVWEKAAELVG